jgi:hypothetical protein
MNERFPQPEGAEAVEGTAAHWVAWEILRAAEITLKGVTPNGQTVTEEMLEGGELLCDIIKARITDQLFHELHIEEQIKIPLIAQSCFGTPDVWAVNFDHNHLEVIDYKFGHRFVDEFWNPQGLCYITGILEHLCEHWKVAWGELINRMTISFTVVQPRCFYRGQPVRTHTFKASDAVIRIMELQAKATLALVHDPTAATNEYCGDCPGRHACPALQLAAYTAAERSNSRIPVELDPAAAGLELRMLERALRLLEARVEGLREVTISNIRAGKQVPYFRVEQGYGRLTWNLPENQIVAIGQMFGKDLSKPGVITPTQAKKIGVSEDVIKAYSFTPQTSLKLIPENPADAARVFSQILHQ